MTLNPSRVTSFILRLTRLTKPPSSISGSSAMANATDANDVATNPGSDPSLLNGPQTKNGPTPPTARISSGLAFPLTVKESLVQWWNRKDLKSVEENVFRCAGITAETQDVEVGKGLYINELELVGPKLPHRENKHIVLVHGYGACKGFFYRNIAFLGSLPGYTIHAVDLLGYGRSTRPKFHLDTNDRIDGVLKAEQFFVNSLEAWREKRGIEKFSLIAHSLGAYVGSAYTHAHAKRVENMVFVSPAGVVRMPRSIPFEEIQARYPNESLEISKPGSTEVTAPAWFEYLWEKNISPFSIVRNAGPFGPKFTSWWSFRTFRRLPADDQEALQKYSYAMFNARGSGEYALNYLLAVGAQGRWPLVERVANLPCNSLWIYGDRDWMDINGGIEACRRINRNGGQAEVTQIKNSGHHLYLDNIPDFNRTIEKWLQKHDT